MNQAGFLTLRTSLTLTQCLDRLSTNTDAGGLWAVKEVTSRVDGDHFQLWRRGSRAGSWTPIWKGEFSTTAEGTEIRGRFRLHAFVRPFQWVWWSGLALFAARLLSTLGVSTYRAWSLGLPGARELLLESAWSGGVLLLMATIAGFATRWGTKLGKEEERHLLRFMEEMFQASVP